MSILIGGFLVLFGLIFFAVGAIPMIIAAASGRLQVWGPQSVYMIFGVVGLIIMVIGAVILVRGLSTAKKKKALAMLIYERGVPTEGTVTFVDKNYSILVNQKPIYFIVEFKFKDGSGREHVVRKSDVESDLVIRLKIEVGSKVQVKYLNEDPQKNILMLPDPQAGR